MSNYPHSDAYTLTAFSTLLVISAGLFIARRRRKGTPRSHDATLVSLALWGVVLISVAGISSVPLAGPRYRWVVVAQYVLLGIGLAISVPLLTTSHTPTWTLR